MWPLLVFLTFVVNWRNHQAATGFVARTTFLPPCPSRNYRYSPLFDGTGVAKDYSWREDALEIEITVSVPSRVRARNVAFKAKQKSIDLRLKGDAKEDEVVLLDGDREMRGKVSYDGTYWVISENEEDRTKKEITVTVEKSMQRAKDDFDIIEYDWKGVYPDDDDEVTERKYEEPEELNVREYAASMGVDIDNINMSKVDKSMFSSGLNMTRKTLDELSKAGYLQEVTQQADGKEFTQDEEGNAVPFSMVEDNVGDKETHQATEAARIPFLDTPSPWHKAVPVQDLSFKRHETMDSNVTVEDRSTAEEIIAGDTVKPDLTADEATDGHLDLLDASDPIDTLTVKRLREVLREQGLKVSGNKQELRDRLRNHVQGLVRENKNKNT